MTTPDLAVIGNNNVADAINRGNQVVWKSLPNTDGDRGFCFLADGPNSESGSFSIGFDEEA